MRYDSAEVERYARGDGMPNARRFRTESVRCKAMGLLALFALPGCFTYSSYQSARIVERGDQQGTIAISRSGMFGEDAGDVSWLAIEGGGRFGIAERIDGALLLSLFQGVPDDWGASVVTADVRVGIIKDRLACTLPVCITVGDFYLASLRVQPGLVATLPLGARAEITGSARAHVFVRIPEVFAMGYTIGLGVTDAAGTWTLRPEVGWMQFTGENSGVTYMQYGLGLEGNFRKVKATKERGS
jgi:hypothetical protein